MLNNNLCKGYLDNAATTRFKPQSVIKALKYGAKHSANAGRGGHRHSLELGLKIEDARESVRKLTGMDNVIFTKNCTEALNLAIFGLELKGEVITTCWEHNSILRPLAYLERQNRIKTITVRSKSQLITADDILPHITSNTKLIALSEMSNVIGCVQPVQEIAELARSKGIPCLIDGAQSLGHVATDYRDISLIASSGHKGLHGVQGTGFLAFKKNLRLTPLLYGGTGTDSRSLAQPHDAPEGLESGTLNGLGICALDEGIKWTLEKLSKSKSRVTNLSESLIEGLSAIDGVRLYYPNTNGIVTFNVAKLPSGEVADILDSRYGLAVRSGLHCAPLAHSFLGTLKNGAVRASLDCANTLNDVYALIDAVKEIANG